MPICGRGGCHTALLLYDPTGTESELIGSVDDDDAQTYEIAGWLTSGERRGIILRSFVTLGFEDIAILTVGADDQLSGQALYWFSDD